MATRTFLDVNVGTDGLFAPVRMFLPPNMDQSGATKYPTLIDVYGGPDSQEVNFRWYVGWGDYLATNYGVIYISIDGRGTGYQSNEHSFAAYGKLGTIEMEDQISVMQSLTQLYPYIDDTKNGIWGWSYGGYATLMTTIQDTSDVFECSLAVAPVTDWLFYDSMYTVSSQSELCPTVL